MRCNSKALHTHANELRKSYVFKKNLNTFRWERPRFLELLTDDREVPPSSTKRLSLQDELWPSGRQSDVRKVEEASKEAKCHFNGLTKMTSRDWESSDFVTIIVIYGIPWGNQGYPGYQKTPFTLIKKNIF